MYTYVIITLLACICPIAADSFLSQQLGAFSDHNASLTITSPTVTAQVPVPVSAEQKAPEWKDIVYKFFGLPGLVIVLIFVGIGFIWWEWDKIRTRPSIAKMINLLPQLIVPKAEPNKYAVMIARLEHDKGDEHQTLLAQGLAEVEGLQPLALKRTMVVEELNVRKSEVKGHEKARKYLNRSGAHVMIWGRVLTHGGKQVPKLYWTVLQPTDDKNKTTRFSIEDKELKLPELFWKELLDVLRLLVINEALNFSEMEGHFVADKLLPFINKVKSLVKESKGRPGWTASDRGMVLHLLGLALDKYGEQTGKNESLEEAIGVYRDALQERSREQMPFEWAITQNNLGNTLSRLGERKSDTALLTDGVKAFRAALQELTLDRVPWMWAMTQTNLGATLASLGGRESNTALLEEGVGAFRAAMHVWSRETMPRQWALLQNNLGSALKSLGERDKSDSGTVQLENAVVAYQAALQERIRERVPMDWATTQTNLGNALKSLGERDGGDSGTARLEEAVEALHAALRVWSLEQTPLQWSTTENNLGSALKSLGERDKSDSGTKQLEEAVEVFQAALRGQHREHVPLDWAATQNNLGNLLVVLATRSENASLICDALNHHLNSWEVYSSANASYNIKVITINIKSDLQQMRATFGDKEYQECLEKHKERLERFRTKDN